MSESSSKYKYPVVIKLALEASGDNGPFRRITFTKKEVDDVYTDDNTAAAVQVSESLLLDTLRARAIELSLSAGSGGPLNVGVAQEQEQEQEQQQYDVQLTYKDGDGDACLVLSNADVVDALLQCQASSLKMFAKVMISAAAPATATAPATTTTTSTTLKNQYQYQYQGNAPIPFHQLVESIVGVLATALLALQAHLGQTSNSVAMIEPKYTNIPKVDVVAKSRKPPAKDTDTTTAAAAPTPTTTTTTAPSTASRCPYSDSAPPDSTAVPCVPEQEPQESCAARPFIHGRHTCDVCLTTPIIGQRFHATNVPDYDLCANCHANYQGKNKEITFEAMELDRDRPFQDRWHRRYSKWGTTGRPHARKHCGTGAAAADVDHGRGRRSGGRYGNRGFATTTTTPTPPAAVPLAKPEDVDSALKEAIRRSMADLMSTVVNNNNTPMSLSARSRSASMKSVEDCADRVVKKMERVASKVSQSARKMADKNDIVVKKLHKKIDKVVARHSFDEKNDIAEKFHEALESAASHVAKSMEMVAAQMDQLVVAKSSSVLEESMPSAPVEKELVEQPPVEKVVVESQTVKQATAVQVESVDIDEDDDNDDDSKPNAVKEPTCAVAEAAVATVATVHDEKEEEIVVEPCVAAVVDAPVHDEEEQEFVDPRCVATVVVDTSASCTTTSSSSTFALDAAGNGDVAADLGATMDKIVTAIQDMKDELDRSSASDSKKQDDIKNAESSDTDSFVDAQDSSEDEEEDSSEDDEEDEETTVDYDDDDEEEEVVTETQGATILSGEETLNKDHDDDDDSGSHNSWMVVHDQATSDEALARAAQVIGSALFNSDMSRSASGNISAMSHSQGTNDHSNVSSAVAESSASSSSESSSQVSSVGSVPTDIPSLATSGGTGTPVVAQAQLDRWVLQLSQLHELGFYNDAICVDILERLQAANVGSGEDEEVTVTQVINELMREW